MNIAFDEDEHWFLVRTETGPRMVRTSGDAMLPELTRAIWAMGEDVSVAETTPVTMAKVRSEQPYARLIEGGVLLMTPRGIVRIRETP